MKNSIVWPAVIAVALLVIALVIVIVGYFADPIIGIKLGNVAFVLTGGAIVSALLSLRA